MLGLVVAYLVSPGSKYLLSILNMFTPDEISSMVLQGSGNLPFVGRNLAVDVIVLGLGYKSTLYDPKFFIKWIEIVPILVIMTDTEVYPRLLYAQFFISFLNKIDAARRCGICQVI